VTAADGSMTFNWDVVLLVIVFIFILAILTAPRRK
jgi:hypothetical protein